MTRDQPATVADASAVLAEVLAEVDAERGRLAAAEADLRAQSAEIGAEAARIRAEHDAACAEARARHTALPPVPAVPDDSGVREALSLLVLARSDLQARQAHTLAEALPRVEGAWCQARPVLDARARALLAQVEALAADYASWWSLVHQARGAAETHDPNRRTIDGPSTRMGTRPDAFAVLAAARGADLCGVEPIPLPPREAPEPWRPKIDPAEYARAVEARIAAQHNPWG